MKRLLYILLLLVLNFTLKAQVTPIGSGYPTPQNLGADSTFVTVKGALGGRLVLYRFTDTTAANSSGRFKNYPFALIGTTSDNNVWYRNKFASAWNLFSSGGSVPNLDSIFVLNDSTWIFCNENGCDTISFNNNNVFVTVNNAFGSCNNLLSGGVVTANNPTVNLVFDVTAASYTIGCKGYNTSATQVTLADGDATFGRFDVIAVDTNEAVIVIQGTPSSDPQVPQINTASQLALTTILVPAGATTATQLGITQTVIYDENLQVAGGEWDSSGVSWARDFANTSFPAHLTKDLLLSGSTVSGSQIQWTTTDTMRKGQFDVFKFYIRLTDAWVTGQGLDISFYNGTTKVSNSVLLQNNSYGFDQTTTGSYQVIAIPMAQFILTDSIYFSVVFKPFATPFSSQAFRLDWVQLQGGIYQALGGSSGLYWWNQYSVPQPADGWVTGNLRLEGNFQSPQRISGNTFYTGSNKVGGFAIANGTEATVVGEWARGTAAGAISMGSQANGKGITISQYGTTSSTTSVNIGGLTNSGTGNVGVGINNAQTGNENVGIGETNQITGSRNVLIGYNGVSNFSNSIGLGYNVAPTASNQFIIAPNATRFTFTGVSRGVAGYVLTDSLGDGQYWVARPSTGSLSAANNGTSVSGTTVRLGQDEAEAGNPAILLSNREIPMANFYLSLNASAAQSNNIFQTKNSSAAVRARITSAASFSNTGGQTDSEVFGDGATTGSTGNSIFGNTATIGTTTNSVLIGQASTIGNGLSGITLVGKGSSHSSKNNTAIFGAGNTSTGRTQAIATNSTFSGDNNFGIGENISVTHTYSGAFGFGATTTANNQVVFGSAQNSATEGEITDFYLGGRGVTTTSPVDVRWTINGASGTNVAGANTYYDASKATGNAAGGVHIFRTSTAGASGTTLQSEANKIQINGSGILAYNGVMPTSGSGGTDSVVARNSSTGQFYLTTVSGGSGFTTADNGLTANTATNVRLGGTLAVNTSIAMASKSFAMTNSGDNHLLIDPSSKLYYLGNVDPSGSFAVEIDGNLAGSPYARIGDVSGGQYVNVNYNDISFYFAGTKEFWVEDNLGAHILAESGETTNPYTVLDIRHNSSGTPAAGFGVGMNFLLETTTTNNTLANQLISKWTTAANATRTSQFSITGVNSATPVTLLTIDGNGLATLGVAGTNKGSLGFAGNTSGTVTIQPAAAAGTWTMTLPINDGDADQVLKTDGNGVTSWATVSGGSTTWDAILSPVADQALTFDAGESSTWTNSNTTEDLFTVNSSTLTTGSFYSLNSTSTALAAGNNLIELVMSGANGTNAITANPLRISVTNTNATSGTNTGISITASGATTANYAINVSAGQVRLPDGSGSVPSIIFAGGLGLFNPTSTDLGIFAGTIERTRVGQTALQFRENTAVIDIGNAGLGGTNRFRISAPAVGTMQLGMESTQQSMIFKGANNAGTDAVGFNLTLQPGAGTGNSTSAGTLIFSTPDAAGSGTTVQSFTTKFTVGRFGGVWASRNQQVQGADVASVAGAIAVGTDGNAFELTGTNAVTLISNLNWQNGSTITFLFTSTATLTDGTANSGTDIGMELAGNANFTGSAGATLTLILSEIGGTQRWREVSRSVQ